VQGWRSSIGDDICWALENAYLWVMMLQILLALGNKPHTFRSTYIAIQIFFAFTMVLTVWISMAILWQDPKGTFCGELQIIGAHNSTFDMGDNIKVGTRRSVGGAISFTTASVLPLTYASRPLVSCRQFSIPYPVLFVTALCLYFVSAALFGQLLPCCVTFVQYMVSNSSTHLHFFNL
jgi:hypothetical protein